MTGSRVRAGFAAATVVAIGLVVGAGISAITTDHSLPDRDRDAASNRQRVLSFPNPLGNGVSITADETAQLLDRCAACISLPSNGPAGVDSISEAWTRDGDDAIAIDFKSGLRIYFLADDRDGQEWAKEAVASDGEDLAGKLGLQLIELRSTLAVGIAAADSGPAALSWIEDGLMVEMLGKGQQSLDELLEIAKSLPGSD